MFWKARVAGVKGSPDASAWLSAWLAGRDAGGGAATATATDAEAVGDGEGSASSLDAAGEGLEGASVGESAASRAGACRACSRCSATSTRRVPGMAQCRERHSTMDESTMPKRR